MSVLCGDERAEFGGVGEPLGGLGDWAYCGGRGGGEVPQKGKKAKNDYSAIADIFQYILVESLRNVKLGFKNRNLLFFNCTKSTKH